MASSLKAAAVILPALGGCATMPDLQLAESGKSVRDIVNRVECELYLATQKHPDLISEGWLAVANLSATVIETGNLSPSLRYINLISGGAFAFSGSATISHKNSRTFTQTFTTDLGKMPKKGHHTGGCEADRKANFDLTGNLAIVETVRMGLDAVPDGKGLTHGSAKNEAFGQTISFVLAKGLSDVGPTWSIEHFIGPGGLGGIAREDTHQLQISFAPAEKAKPGAPRDRESAKTKARDLNNTMQLQQPLSTFRGRPLF